MAERINIGEVSAYALARKYGYTGTEEEWAREQSAAGENAKIARENAEKTRADLDAVNRLSGELFDTLDTAVQNVEDTARDRMDAISEMGQGFLDTIAESGTAQIEAVESTGEAWKGSIRDQGESAEKALGVVQQNAENVIAGTKQDVLTAITESKTAAVEAIRTEGTTSAKGVRDEKEAALASIRFDSINATETLDTKKQEALQAIADDKAEALKAISDDSSDAETAIAGLRDSAQTAISADRKKALDSITADKNAALSAIQAKHDSCISAIEEKTDEQLAKLPEVDELKDVVASVQETNAELKKTIEDPDNGFAAIKGNISALTNTEDAPVEAGKVWTSTADGAEWADAQSGGGLDADALAKLIGKPFKQSGSVVVCNPIPGTKLTPVSTITAWQEGNGNPSTDNVRPIHGWNGAKLYLQTGTNLFNNATPYKSVSTNDSANQIKTIEQFVEGLSAGQMVFYGISVVNYFMFEEE